MHTFKNKERRGVRVETRDWTLFPTHVPNYDVILSEGKDSIHLKMFRDASNVEKLSAEVSKKSRQIDMLESSINKLTKELEEAKANAMELRKV